MLLVEAAKRTGLEEPYVHVMELGDYTVVYRISGLLKDVKRLVTSRSRLRIESMNTLHDAGIEVMSPSVMMQRPIPSEERIMPKRFASSEFTAKEDKPLPEARIFDKAEEAEALEWKELELTGLMEERVALEALISKTEDDAKAKSMQTELAALDERIREMGNKDEG